MPRKFGKSGYAVIDIGSNSVRMVIYDVSVFPPQQIFNEKVYCALGRDLGTSGQLNPDGCLAAFKTIQAYQLIAESQSVGRVDAVATAALRDAKDGQDFIRAVHKETGIDIRVLSGKEEASYAASGVLALDSSVCGVVADFGGGSLELAKVEQKTVFDLVSLPLGAFRVLAMEDDANDLVPSMLAEQADIFGSVHSLYAIGGSWRALARAYMTYTGTIQPVQGYSIPASSLVEFCQVIETSSPDILQKEYHLEGHRTALAGVSALVLRHLMKILSPQLFIVSEAGVRDGMVYEYLSSDRK